MTRENIENQMLRSIYPLKESFYYVYVINFDSKFYYGITKDPARRKISHHEKIIKAYMGIQNGYADLKVHIEGAKYFKRNYKHYRDIRRTVHLLDFNVFFKSSSKQACEQVESFMIQMAKNDKNCLNCKPGKKLTV